MFKEQQLFPLAVALANTLVDQIYCIYTYCFAQVRHDNKNILSMCAEFIDK